MPSIHDFEGRVLRFTEALTPPAGLPGWKVLAGLAQQFGLPTGAERVADVTAEIERAVSENLGGRAAYFWNVGEERPPLERTCLVSAAVQARAPSLQPPLTHAERYKRELREVGTERFRVQ